MDIISDGLLKTSLYPGQLSVLKQVSVECLATNKTFVSHPFTPRLREHCRRGGGIIGRARGQEEWGEMVSPEYNKNHCTPAALVACKVRTRSSKSAFHYG